MLIIAIDNGVTGTITIMNKETGELQDYFPIPVKTHLKYTKKKQWIKRVDWKELRAKLELHFPYHPKAYLERPMVNPTRFKASESALRCLEATLIVLEMLGIPYEFIDSKEWLREMLLKGLKGTAELKKASLEKARQMFPGITIYDGDSLLMAEYIRRKR